VGLPTSSYAHTGIELPDSGPECDCVSAGDKAGFSSGLTARPCDANMPRIVLELLALAECLQATAVSLQRPRLLAHRLENLKHVIEFQGSAAAHDSRRKCIIREDIFNHADVSPEFAQKPYNFINKLIARVRLGLVC
jgi:hypothetical protein